MTRTNTESQTSNTIACTTTAAATTTMRLVAACRDPRSQCALVLAANAALLACGAAEPFTAAFALHLVLLPFNAWRLMLALIAGRSSHAWFAMPKQGDVVATRQRIESMRYRVFDAAATIQTVRLGPRCAKPKI